MTLDADKGDSRFATDVGIRIRQGDSLSYELDIDVRQGGEALDLSGRAVRLYATKPDGSTVIDGENVSVADAAAGRVVYTVPPQLVDAVGRVAPCYLRITEAGNQSEWSLSTASFELDVVRGVGANLASGEYIPEIDGLLADMDRQLSDFSQAEESRASGEEARETAEQDRAEAERLRREAETARLANESSRTSAEDDRAAAESSRVTAEQARAAAEADRAAEFALFESKAQEWVPRILVDGEYDPVTRKPTLTAGEFCTVYMSPSADAADMNAYDEYMWVPATSEAGGHFEKLGASSVDFPAATSDEVAGILDGTVTQGGAGITVTAMAALKAAFDDAYAASEHSHAIADVTGLRGELDDLDAAIGKLPVMADVDAKAGTGSGEEKVDSADVKGSPGEGGYMDVYAKKGGDALMLRAWDAGTVEMIRFDGDGYESDWELNAHHLLSDIRGSATDLSYAALRALKPGCYLVPSTAANQPTSGQGDGNLLVGRVSGNRVWAVVAYNTGACYMAYGYAVGESDANFNWARIDDHGMLFNRQRGTITDASFANLYAMSETPGTYLLMNDATNNPSSGNYGNVLLARSAGDRMVCVVFSDSGAVYAARGYNGTWAWVRMDVNGTGGVLPTNRGGTNASTVKGAVKNLFPTDSQTTATRVCVAQTDGGYSGMLSFNQLMQKMFPTPNPSMTGTVPYVPVFGGNGYSPVGYFSMEKLMAAMGIGSYHNGNAHQLKVGDFQIATGWASHVQVANQAVHSMTISYGLTFSAAPVVVLSDSVDHEEYAAGGWTGLSASNVTTTGFKLERYNGAGYECSMGCFWVAIGKRS